MATEKENLAPSEEDEKKIKSVLPWGNPRFLSEVIEERAKEREEAIEIVEGLIDPDILPGEIKSIVKKPDKKELIEEIEE
ncbi:hypothetical protein A3L08_07645 [Thermococcus pacificus]|uniref:Uncharacterized protein n=2 Tax=Thermococcus pacificus TaxID=71998 RepID=A0A218PA80_9EURY|nr:hypothetical protein A3L08_07645 [Thermococcus pacificus]